MAKLILLQLNLMKKIYTSYLYILADQNVIDREFNTYKNISDNYSKYIISMNKFNFIKIA